MPNKRKNTKKDVTLFELLKGSLAEEEIRHVLIGALLSLDSAGLGRLIKRLEINTGETVQRVMDSYGKGISGSEPAPGRAKIRQEWDRAISDWRDCVYESGYEEGKYVIQDHHWEAPYLDTSALAGDLEDIAARMRALIPRVVDDDIDPEFDFFDFAVETVDEVGSGLPEWMDSWEEEYLFGDEGTRCLLEWTWRTTCAKQTTIKPFELIDSVLEFESANDRLYLEGDAVVEFVLSLDEECQKEILAGIEENRGSPRWRSVLDSVRSGWFLLHTELLKRWSKARHAEICRENIQKDWKLALPVLEGLLENNAFEEAVAIAEEAMQGVLHSKDGVTWNPTEALLICHLQPYLYQSSEDAIVRLFELWSQAARGIGNDELSSALALQAVMIDKWEDWDTVLPELEKRSMAGLVALSDRCFLQWKHFVAENTERYVHGKEWRAEWSWVPILMDAARAKKPSRRSFHKSMRHWLQEAGQSESSVKRMRGSLERLTLDMNNDSAVRKVSLTLYQIIFSKHGGDSLLDQSRRRWLERLDASVLFSDVMALWKKAAPHLVPDPAESHQSRYEHHAEWLKALYELNRREYDKLIRQWRDVHRRRINLWKAISELGLPVPEKR